LSQFTKNILTDLSKIWGWDPGSGKILVPDPGLKKAPDPRSGSATLIDGLARMVDA
jgi:hypothetical protein